MVKWLDYSFIMISDMISIWILYWRVLGRRFIYCVIMVDVEEKKKIVRLFVNYGYYDVLIGFLIGGIM